MNTLTWGLITVSVSTCLSVLGLWALKSTPKAAAIDRHQHMAGSTLSVVGTLFSVVLGFLVAVSLHSYETARDTVESEANRVADVFILARGLPEQERRDIRQSCRQYCRAVVTDEWLLMEANKTSQDAWKAYYTLWDQVLSIKPSDEREADIHGSMLSAMQGLGEQRRTRIANLNSKMSPALWVVAASGSVVIVLITYVLATEASLVPCLITAFLTASLALNIFLLSVYSSPFSGVLKISPHGFELDRELFMQDDSPAAFSGVTDRLKGKPGGQAAGTAQTTQLPMQNGGSAQTSSGTANQPNGRERKKQIHSKTANTILIKDLKIGP